MSHTKQILLAMLLGTLAASTAHAYDPDDPRYGMSKFFHPDPPKAPSSPAKPSSDSVIVKPSSRGWAGTATRAGIPFLPIGKATPPVLTYTTIRGVRLTAKNCRETYENVKKIYDYMRAGGGSRMQVQDQRDFVNEVKAACTRLGVAVD